MNHTTRLSVSFLVVALLSLTYFEVTTFRFLYADGVGDFFGIVARERPIFPHWSKFFGDYIQAAPTLFARKVLGVVDLRLLAQIFGATLFIHSLISLWISWKIVKKSHPVLFVFPLLCYLSATLSTSLMMMSEAHLCTSFFWPLFLLFLTRTDLSKTEATGTMIGCLLFTSLYQTALFLSPILLVTLFRRRSIWKKLPQFQHRCLGLACFMLLVSIFSNGYAIVHYSQIGNRDNYIANLWMPWFWQNPIALFSILSSVLILGQLVIFSFKKPRTEVLIGLFSALSYLSSATLGSLLIYSSELSRPWFHHGARVLLLYIPVALSLIALFLPSKKDFLVLPNTLKNQMAFFCVCALTYQFLLTGNWSGFYSRFSTELVSHQGIVPYEATQLGPTNFVWGWTNPFLSIIVSGLEGRSVRSIIRVPVGEHYDPLKLDSPETILSLRQYGVRYEWNEFAKK